MALMLISAALGGITLLSKTIALIIFCVVFVIGLALLFVPTKPEKQQEVLHRWAPTIYRSSAWRFWPTAGAFNWSAGTARFSYFPLISSA